MSSLVANDYNFHGASMSLSMIGNHPLRGTTGEDKPDGRGPTDEEIDDIVSRPMEAPWDCCHDGGYWFCCPDTDEIDFDPGVLEDPPDKAPWDLNKPDKVHPYEPGTMVVWAGIGPQKPDRVPWWIPIVNKPDWEFPTPPEPPHQIWCFWRVIQEASFWPAVEFDSTGSPTTTAAEIATQVSQFIAEQLEVAASQSYNCEPESISWNLSGEFTYIDEDGDGELALDDVLAEGPNEPLVFRATCPACDQ